MLFVVYHAKDRRPRRRRESVVDGMGSSSVLYAGAYCLEMVRKQHPLFEFASMPSTCGLFCVLPCVYCVGTLPPREPNISTVP